MRILFLLLACIGIELPGRAQTLLPEQMAEEVEQVRKLFHGWHPDPYACLDRSQVDVLFDTLRARCMLPLPIEGYFQQISMAMAGLCDGATQVLPPAELDRRLHATDPLLPVKVRIIEGGFFVDAETKGFRSLPRGSRILELDGRDSRQVLELLEQRVSADGCAAEARHRVIEREFALLYRLAFGAQVRHVLTCEAPDGERVTQPIMPLSGEQMRLIKGPPTSHSAPWRYVVDEESGTAWVELTTFERTALEHAGVRPQRFVEELAVVLRKRQVRHLVLDLRGSSGMDIQAVEALAALVAEAPFQLLQDIHTRNVAPPAGVRMTADVSGLYELLRTTFAPAGDGTFRPTDALPGLAMAQPLSKDLFTGRVYIVQDASTRESAALLAMHLQRTGRGLGIGGSTGSTAGRFCSGPRLEVPLRHSGAVVVMPTLVFVPALEAPEGHCVGSAPQRRVEPLAGALAKGRDSIRQAVLLTIQALQ